MDASAKMPERDKYDCEIGKHIMAVRRASEMADQLNGSIGRLGDRVMGGEPPTPTTAAAGPRSQTSCGGLLGELEESLITLGEKLERGQYLAGRLSNLG